MWRGESSTGTAVVQWVEQLIRKLIVWFLCAASYESECPWARYWTPFRSRCCVIMNVHECIPVFGVTLTRKVPNKCGPFTSATKKRSCEVSVASKFRHHQSISTLRAWRWSHMDCSFLTLACSFASKLIAEDSKIQKWYLEQPYRVCCQ